MLRSDSERLVEPIKKGKRTYGAIVTHRITGHQVYYAYREQKHVFLGGRKSLGAAMKDGCASWAIDCETLEMLLRRGVKTVIILVKGLGYQDVAPIEKFYNSASVLNYEKKGGALQRYLPLHHFHRVPTTISL